MRKVGIQWQLGDGGSIEEITRHLLDRSRWIKLEWAADRDA